MEAADGYLTDLAGLAVSVGLLGAYHLFLTLRLRHDPSHTIQAVNRAARTAWVESVMMDESRNVLAVQTLRNSTMAATFLASTAIILIMGVLTLSSQWEQLGSSWQRLDILDSRQPGLGIAKLLLLLVDLFFAFFGFAMSVRLFNHVGYQINIPPDKRPGDITPILVARHLNRAGAYYSLGMRAYYFTVPLVFWLFGPQFMLVATIVLILLLYHLDRRPPSE
jgi:uncharacterized membrane protein